MAYSFIQQFSVSNAGPLNQAVAGISPQPTITKSNVLAYVAKYTFASSIAVVVTDLLGNVFVPVGNYWDGGLTNSGFQWGYSIITNGGLDNVIATFGAQLPTFNSLFVAEFAGLDITALFNLGGTSILKSIAPGPMVNSITSGLTQPLARDHGVLFGFTMNSSASTGQSMTAGTGFTGLTPVWLFGSGNNFTGLPEHTRVNGSFSPVQAFTTGSVGVDTYFSIAMFLAEAGAGFSSPASLMGQYCL